VSASGDRAGADCLPAQAYCRMGPAPSVARGSAGRAAAGSAAAAGSKAPARPASARRGPGAAAAALISTSCRRPDRPGRWCGGWVLGRRRPLQQPDLHSPGERAASALGGRPASPDARESRLIRWPDRNTCAIMSRSEKTFFAFREDRHSGRGLATPSEDRLTPDTGLTRAAGKGFPVLFGGDRTAARSSRSCRRKREGGAQAPHPVQNGPAAHRQGIVVPCEFPRSVGGRHADGKQA
jgi:hypothetical protein